MSALRLAWAAAFIWVAVPMTSAGQAGRPPGGAPAEFARHVVTSVVELPAAGIDYEIKPMPGATVLGPAAGTAQTRRLILSLHLSGRFAAGRQQVATVQAGGYAHPVLVDVQTVHDLAVAMPATVSLKPGRRDSITAVVSNRGSADEQVTLTTKAAAGVRVSAGPAVSLSGGESVRVVIRIASERGSAPGIISLEARSGAASGRGTTAYEVAAEAGHVFPVALQGVAGAGGAGFSVHAEGAWSDSVRVRLAVGPRPPLGLGQVFWAPEPRAFTVRAPGWGFSMGEVRRTGDLLEPGVFGLGMQGQWGRRSGWVVSGAVARPISRYGGVSTGVDGGVRLEGPVGATRFVLGVVSAGGLWNDRLSVLSLGVRPEGSAVSRWSASVGLAAGNEAATAVGRLSGNLTSGALRFDGEIARSAAARLGGLVVSDQARAVLELGGPRASVFAQGAASAEEADAGQAGRGSGSGLLGLRLQGGTTALELRGGWRGASGIGHTPRWGARVVGSSMRMRLGAALRLGLGYDHAWSGAGGQDHGTASLEWAAPHGNAWLQAERGLPLSPYPGGRDRWGLRIGGQLRGELWRAAVNGGIEDAGGGLTATGFGELAWRARRETELLFGVRRLGPGAPPVELFVGVRQRVGVPFSASRTAASAVRFGELVVTVAFASDREGAIERVPRGVVRLGLPGGGTIEAQLEGGRAVFSALPAGRYRVEHIPPEETTVRVAAVASSAEVRAGRTTDVRVVAVYLPRAMAVVQLGADRLGAGGQAVPGPGPTGTQGPAGECGRAIEKRPPSVQSAMSRGVIVPEMIEGEVVCVLGPPVVRRTTGEWTYLFYAGVCRWRGHCGLDDVVFLQDNRVVTAYLRGRRRRYEGPAPGPALGGRSRPGD